MTARVTVVGAGPAGSIAALVLARAGVEVDLLDRANFPRPKLCGDTVNPGTLALLDRLGVGQAVRSGARRITGMLVTGRADASVAADYPGALHGAAIERRDFDSILVEAAISAGATFCENARVDAPLIGCATARVAGVRGEFEGVARELESRFVVAADGRGSRLGSALGLTRFARRPRRWAFGAYYTGVDALTFRGEMHIRRDGYLGIAPLSDALANVCVVKEIGAARQPSDDAAANIDAAIEADPRLRPRFARARRVTPVTVLGPLAIEASAAGCPGLVLAGDASGFVDPMTGDGLRFAVEGGVLAAQAVLHELRRGEPAFHWLDRARSRAFRGKWRLNRTLRWVVSSGPALDAMTSFGTRFPFAIRTLIAMAGDVRLAG